MLPWLSQDFKALVEKFCFLIQQTMVHNISFLMIWLNCKPYCLNFFSGDNCQVDVIDAIKGASLPYKKFIDKYVVKVEPHRAIMEPDYFIKLIELAEQKRTEEIERVESGGLDSDEEIAQRQARQNEEWERL
jgi:hypothetical protein